LGQPFEQRDADQALAGPVHPVPARRLTAMVTHARTRGLTVLFCGATGRLAALTPLLLRRGHQVLAATRDPASPAARRLRQAGAHLVRADFDDPASLRAAAAHADAVVAAGTAHAAGPAADIQHGRNVIDAASAARAGHLVYVTAAGASQPTGVPVIDSKHTVEQYLRASGVPHTIIAPVYFMENVWNPWNQAALATSRWPSPVTRTRLLQQIPLADVLAFTAHVLDSRDVMLGQRIEIASDQLTADDATGIISSLLSHPVQVAEPPPGDVNPLFAWLEHAGPAVDIAALRRRYPQIGWHSFANWAAAQDWHALLRPGSGR
jgi:uncharacterized protein YbjT (DUF2867 family)